MVKGYNLHIRHKKMQFSMQNYMPVCTKIVGGRCSAPNPAGGAPPDPLIRFSPVLRAINSQDFGGALPRIYGTTDGRGICTPGFFSRHWHNPNPQSQLLVPHSPLFQTLATPLRFFCKCSTKAARPIVN